MSDTFTNNLNLTKPAVGGSTDTWGTKINNDLDAVDAIFSATGTEVNVRFNTANFDDNKKALFGTGDDLEIYHNINNFIVGTPKLLIQSDDTTDGVEIGSFTGSEVMAKFTKNGAVSLYHDNSLKLATASSGVSITGDIAVSGTVDGVDIAALNTTVAGKADTSSLATVATSGAYSDLTGAPTIPTNNNQLTNGAGFTTYTSNQATDTTAGVTFAELTIAANGDIEGNYGNWTGEKSAKLQFHSGHFYVQTTNSFYFRNYSSGNGDDKISFDNGGNIVAEGNITAYGSVSDERLKENIEVIDNAIDKVNQLKGVTFNYKKDGKVGTGLIAQDLEKVLPEAVYTAQALGDHLKDEEPEEHLAINYGNTVGLLVEAIKELEARIKDLEGK